MICTFFGHSDTPETVKPTLKTAIIELIEKEHVTGFYVGKLNFLFHNNHASDEW